MSTSNESRGTVELVEIEILYPDGSIVNRAIRPMEESAELLAFDDSLIERFVFPRLDDESKSAIRGEWYAENKSWEHRPSFIALPANGATRDMGNQPCNCCHYKHASDVELKSGNPKDKNTVLRFPTTASKNRAKMEGITERGKILEISVLVRYPSDEEAITIFNPIRDHLGILALSDQAVKHFVEHAISEDDMNLLNVWNQGNHWKERHSFLWISHNPQSSRSRFGCSCCPYAHPIDNPPR